MNLQRHLHLPSDGCVRLTWADEGGQLKCVAARCIDVSDKRIHIEVPEWIPRRTRVTLRGDGLNVAGSGWVKYATSCDSKFILMLELN